MQGIYSLAILFVLQDSGPSRLETIKDGLVHPDLSKFLVIAALLFIIGVAGVLTRRNILVIFMSVELILNAANLNFIAFSRYLNDPAGQIFVFFILTVAAAESAIGLAILVVLFRNLSTINVEDLDKLKG